MNNERIKELALANGFNLKEQSDGTMELNPYVYEFVKALLKASYEGELFTADILSKLVVGKTYILKGIKEQDGFKCKYMEQDAVGYWFRDNDGYWYNHNDFNYISEAY